MLFIVKDVEGAPAKHGRHDVMEDPISGEGGRVVSNQRVCWRTVGGAVQQRGVGPQHRKTDVDGSTDEERGGVAAASNGRHEQAGPVTPQVLHWRARRRASQELDARTNGGSDTSDTRDTSDKK